MENLLNLCCDIRLSRTLRALYCNEKWFLRGEVIDNVLRDELNGRHYRLQLPSKRHEPQCSRMLSDLNSD